VFAFRLTDPRPTQSHGYSPGRQGGVRLNRVALRRQRDIGFEYWRHCLAAMPGRQKQILNVFDNGSVEPSGDGRVALAGGRIDKSQFRKCWLLKAESFFGHLQQSSARLRSIRSTRAHSNDVTGFPQIDSTRSPSRPMAVRSLAGKIVGLIIPPGWLPAPLNQSLQKATDAVLETVGRTPTVVVSGHSRLVDFNAIH